jgi:hypothetical protein
VNRIGLGQGAYLEPDEGSRNWPFQKRIVPRHFVELECVHRVPTFGDLRHAAGVPLCAQCPGRVQGRVMPASGNVELVLLVRRAREISRTARPEMAREKYGPHRWIRQDLFSCLYWFRAVPSTTGTHHAGSAQFLESPGSDCVLASAIDQFAFSVRVFYELQVSGAVHLRRQPWSPMSTVIQGGHGDHSSGGEPL